MATTNRQKITAIAVVIILLIVIWQVIGLFKGTGGGSQQPAPLVAARPGAAMTAGSPTQPAAAQQQIPKAAPVSKDMELLRLQQDTQSKYIAALNELQMLKVQREINETNQAIAQAKLATIKAEKNMNDLLTGASNPPPPPVPASAYAAQLGSQPQQLPLINQPTNVPPPPPAEPSYVVISVSYQLGRWTAVIGNQGKLYNVSRGDVLPVDGSIVSNIDKGGVVLTKDGKRKRVSLISAI